MPIPAGPPLLLDGAIDARLLTWTSPTGLVCPLDRVGGLAGFGWAALSGVRGLGAAPVTIASDPSPFGGATARHVQPTPRAITLPLYVEATDSSSWGAAVESFTASWRTLAEAFAETSQFGPGTLAVGRPDGTTRLIAAYYMDGFDEVDGLSIADTCVVSLWCPDPYWRDLDPTLITRSNLPLGSSFLDPFPTVSSSQTLGATVVHNPGGIKAWPTWTLAGPASALTATQLDSGESWTLDVVAFRGTPLIAGETVTVTTNPPSVVGPDGSNWTGALDWPNASLWGIPRGDTSVSFVASASGTTTAVEASFYARYETA